jgi:hypothetical protein
MVGVCLVAVFALAAITAGSASAKTPEWGKCVAKAGGKYLDGGCQTKGKGGSFEWEKGSKLPNVPFTGKNIGSGGVLTSTLRVCEAKGKSIRVPRKKCAEEGGEEYEAFEEPVKIECEAETSSGEAVGKNKIAKVNVAFKGCKLFGAFTCTSAGSAPGEVKTQELKGFLGYIEAGKGVGVVLEPAKKHAPFAVFTCETLEVVVGVGSKKEGAQYEDSPGVENHGGYDQIISPITPTNEMTTEYTQVYTVSSEAPFGNIPANLDGKHISALEDHQVPLSSPTDSSQWSAAGEEITNVNTPTEAGEIKA